MAKKERENSAPFFNNFFYLQALFIIYTNYNPYYYNIISNILYYIISNITSLIYTFIWCRHEKFDAGIKIFMPAPGKVMLAWKIWCVHQNFDACIRRGHAGTKNLVCAPGFWCRDLKKQCMHEKFGARARILMHAQEREPQRDEFRSF